MRSKRFLRALASIVAIMSLLGLVSAASTTATLTVEKAYPNLASGILTHARFGELPEGQILKSDSVVLTTSDLEQELKSVPFSLEAEMQSNRFFLLEEMAEEKILSALALQDVPKEDAGDRRPRDPVEAYLDKAIGTVKISDEEISAFYEDYKDLLGGAPLDQIKGDLEHYLLGQKRDKAANDHVRSIGRTRSIIVSADWVKAQAPLAFDNTVDKARTSGRPTLVDFGAAGCCGPVGGEDDPTLSYLQDAYNDKANIEYLDVEEHPVLAARCGVRSVPVQILYDKAGKEVWRHTGPISEEKIEKELLKLGVKGPETP